MAVLNSIVKGLVIAKIEAFLLELPLHSPIGLGNKAETRMLLLDGRDDFDPVFGSRWLSGAPAPCTFKNCIQEKHGHITADSIALFSYARYSFDGGLSQAWFKGVQLQDVGPCREIGVPSTSKYRSPQFYKREWVVTDVAAISTNEVLRMLMNPRVIWRDMIGNKIENQVHPTLGQFTSSSSKPIRSPKMFVDHVSPHTIGGSDVVCRLIIGKSALKGIQKIHVLIRDGDANRASLPHSHQPDSIEAICRDTFPLVRGDRRQIYGPAVFFAELGEPDPGINLIHRWISRPN